ncbi:hypothetical protein CHS0354_025717 [Potamilus streckersoni]|uniref:Sulfotransferase domain-containing protein n=1 Tax=Potamilus streckersoni TaxID=2493646 RepID=A0AAE0VNG9_9BIVA|nr:hypothetical protein CHS0354_025717 [Potamilus streckersoni]
MALAIGSLRRRLAPWCGLLIIFLGLWIFSFFHLLDFAESDSGSVSDVPKNVYSKRALILHPSKVLKADNNGAKKKTFSFKNLKKVSSMPKTVNFQEIFDYKLYPKLGAYSPHWDLLHLGPFELIKGSKNPCWFNNEHFVVCLPYFYVIGAPKCGTTDLFAKISVHPEFISPIVKEPEWISYDRFEYLTSDLSIYVSNFAPIAYNIQRGYKDGQYKGVQFVTGDFSPTTMWQNDNWPWLPGNTNLREPNITNADYVKHLNPNVKIIAILRNPTDRLFSDYLHFRNQYATASIKDFHHWASLAVEVFKGCLESKKSARECAYNEEVASKTVRKNEEVASKTGMHLRIGLYAIYLRDWFKVIPTKNILVLRLEDHEKQPQKTMKAIFAFLGLKTDKKLISRISKQMKANGKEEMRSYRSTLGPMLPKTRQILDTFYKPFNIDLAQLLNDDKFNY